MQFALRRTLLQVIIAVSLLANYLGTAIAPCDPRRLGVVVACPDLVGRWEVEQVVHGLVYLVRVAAGEVAPRGADVGVEEGVAAEDVGCELEGSVAARDTLV